MGLRFCLVKFFGWGVAFAALGYVSYNIVMAKNKIHELITEFLEYLEVEKNRSQNTVRNYDFYLRKFVDWAGISRPAQIDTGVVRKYRLMLHRFVDPKTERSEEHTSELQSQSN